MVALAPVIHSTKQQKIRPCTILPLQGRFMSRLAEQGAGGRGLWAGERAVFAVFKETFLPAMENRLIYCFQPGMVQ